MKDERFHISSHSFLLIISSSAVGKIHNEFREREETPKVVCEMMLGQCRDTLVHVLGNRNVNLIKELSTEIL